MHRNMFVSILIISGELVQSHEYRTNNKGHGMENDALNPFDNVSWYHEIRSENLILVDPTDISNDLLEGSEHIEITADVEGCMEAGYNTVCSGKGRCVNNSCICNSYVFEVENDTVSYNYTGQYCEECPYCKGQRCHLFLPCVECNLQQKNTSCNDYCRFQHEFVDKVIRNVDDDEKICEVENSDGCFFKFKYRYNAKNSILVHFEKDFVCYNGLQMVIFAFWGIVIYVFALMLLVPRICFYFARKNIMKSRTSLSRGYDVLRLNILNLAH